MKNTPRGKSGSAHRPSFGKSSDRPQGRAGSHPSSRPTERTTGKSSFPPSRKDSFIGEFDKKPRRFTRDDDRPARSERPEQSGAPASRFGKKPAFGRSAPASAEDRPYTKRSGPFKPRAGDDKPRRFTRDGDRPERTDRSDHFEKRERSEGYGGKAPSRFGKPDSYKPREGGFDKKTRRFDREDDRTARPSTPRYAKKPDFKKKHEDKKFTPRTPTVVAKKGFQPRRESMNRQGVLLWGIHAVREAWLNPARKVYRLWMTEAAHEAAEEMFAKAQQEGLARPNPIIAEKSEIEHFLPHGSVHQGVAMEVEPLKETTLDDYLADSTESDLVIILDQVSDPHNVGAILRSAAAFGARAVIVTERNAPNMTGTMAKTACGALEHVALIPVVNIARTLTTLKEENYWCVGLAEEGDHDMAASKLSSGRVALVMGAEGDGLRRLTREQCDELARLPTGGAIGSLNVSNAAAIALYEVVRQRTQNES